MEIRQLKYFVEICRCKSFSQAAEFCYISSQGLSMSIMRLEKELGCKLFIRSARGVVLTPQAEFLLPKAKKILSVIDECDNYFGAQPTGDVVIPVAFSHGTIEEFAGDVISEFSANYPDCKIMVRECADMECDEAVLNEETEFALTVGPISEERFTSHKLLSSRYALIVSDKHPLASRDRITIDELENLSLAVMKGGVRTYSHLRAACLKAGFEPNIQVFADNILLVFYMATKDVCGISTQHLFNRLNPPHLCAIPIDCADFTWDIYQIKKKDATLSPRVRPLWQALLSKSKIGTK